MSRRQLKYRIDGADVTTSTENGGDSRGIRGPNSALTEFLRQQGINAEEIRQRHLRRLRGETSDDEAEAEDRQSAEVSESIVTGAEDEVLPEADESECVELEIRIAARRKRRAARGKNEDDEYTDDSDEDEDAGTDEPIAKRKIIGEITNCYDCGTEFTITLHSRNTNNQDGHYCDDCKLAHEENDKLTKKQQLISRKKRQRLAVALLDRQDVKLPSLQDLSIRKIADKIEYVEEFGGIGSINMQKIARILCRNRSLNDNTLKLFLEVNLTKLEFWDCSKLTKKSYDSIVSFCPNLKELKLLMCGRLHNDNMSYFGSNLQHLTSLELDGPFLISNDAWQKFFTRMGTRLTSFKVSNTHRFNNETFKHLLEKCGENLVTLKVSRLDGINEKESYDLMPIYLTKLQDLEISYPHHEDLVTDSLLINLLGINGEFLNRLVLDGCSALTDEFLINGIRPFCISLRTLSLQKLDQITSEGFVGLFHDWRANYGLNEVCLTKCFSLGDEGIIEMLLHSGTSLVELSINSVKDLSIVALELLKCPHLTYLDAGFVRTIDDDVLQLIGKNCSQLKVMDCYGNNRCTSKATIREGLKVIGRQSDLI